MTSQPKGTIFPKQQLEIVQVNEEKTYGAFGKTLLPIMAKNLSLGEGDPLRDKSLKFVVFNPALQAHVKGLAVGARFLADIEERDRPDTEYGPDRTINQIYDQGQAVSKPGAKAGGYGKSPEIVRLEHDLDLELEGVKRRSIEGQTAVAQVGIVLTSPTPIPGEDLGIDEESWARILGKYWQAIERGLDNYLVPQLENKTPAPAPKAVQKSQDNKEGVEKTAGVSDDAPPLADPIKHVGDLLTRALKLKPPVTRDELVIALGINDPKDIADLEAVWKTAQEMSASKIQGKSKVGEKQPGKGADEKAAAEKLAESEHLFD